MGRWVGQGEVSGATAVADLASRLLQLALEKARSELDGLLFCFLHHMAKARPRFPQISVLSPILPYVR